MGSFISFLSNLYIFSQNFSLKKRAVIPFDKKTIQKKGHGFHYNGKEFVHHSTLDDSESSFHRLSIFQAIIIFSLLTILTLSFVTNWHATLVVVVTGITVLYFADLLFNFYLIYRSFMKPIEIKVTAKEIEKIQEWPRYTIMCPLYKEWQVVPQFVEAMSKLDYPQDKLQIMLLLEADDIETIEHVKKFNLPKFFDVVIVPDSQPKTKPKACNYGLKKATGDQAAWIATFADPDGNYFQLMPPWEG